MAYKKGVKSKKSVVKIEKQEDIKEKELLVKSQEIEQQVEQVEEVDQEETEDIHYSAKKSVIEDILFKLPNVSDPIIGTPKQVQDKLDKIALSIQKRPKSAKSQILFDQIHLYMHGYLINIVLKQFPYIKGMQTADIYQQTLIALWSKAIPNFRTDKGMSFLNFAKMCIRRHLITILNTAKTRQKDQSINQAISLDSYPPNTDEDSHNTFSNIIPDKDDPVDKKTANEEAYIVTRDTLLEILSEFERVVLNEYLSTSTYKEIATNISKVNRKRCVPKSVDNALLRIRKKAVSLRENGKIEDIPLFIV
jgi:RNA polymerase sporulation-specific sigma factor